MTLIMTEQEIQKELERLGDNGYGYKGIDMSLTHSSIDRNLPEIQENEKLLSHFNIPRDITRRLTYWKGSVNLHEYANIIPSDCGYGYGNVIKDFSGWTSSKIIEYLFGFAIAEKAKEEDEIYEDEAEEIKIDIPRIISKKDRYEVLRRQRWNCNICHCKLKYSKDSDWDGEIAHIDHIHPFSKRYNYPKGFQFINEIENLQALCPKCNLSKSKKEIN